MKINAYKKLFFNKLAEKLEELYPKGEVIGKSNPRSRALVFNAYANLIFREILDKIDGRNK